jgi:hypothetical protein
VDIVGEEVEWGSVMRIRVIIDIQKPLERGRSLNIGGKSHWVSFKYENLPVFCFNCGRIAHGENGCPTRSRPDQKKEWGVWLRAEKFRSQGMGRGFGQQNTELSQGRSSGNTGKMASGGSIQTGATSSEIGGPAQQPTKERAAHVHVSLHTLGGTLQAGAAGSGLGGNPKPNQQFTKESTAHISGGTLQTGEAGSGTGGNPKPNQVSDAHLFNMESSLPKIAGEAFNVELGDSWETEGISEGKSGEKYLETSMGKLAPCGKLCKPGQQSGDQMGLYGPKEKVGSNGHKDLLGVNYGGSSNESLLAQKVGKPDHSSNTTEKFLTGKNEGKLEEQSYQERNKNILKIWKRVTRSGEEELFPEDSNNSLLGKRKGETEEPISDEQRHLKIRKWEDYLEEEFDNEDDEAEAAEQPRQQP